MNAESAFSAVFDPNRTTEITIADTERTCRPAHDYSAGLFICGQDADLERAPVMNAEDLREGLPRFGGADQDDRWLSQSSVACATSRQPWSIVSEWPRSGNSMKSVMAPVRGFRAG
jgi:hypothetical protein